MPAPPAASVALPRPPCVFATEPGPRSRPEPSSPQPDPVMTSWATWNARTLPVGMVTVLFRLRWPLPWPWGQSWAQSHWVPGPGTGWWPRALPSPPRAHPIPESRRLLAAKTGLSPPAGGSGRPPPPPASAAPPSPRTRRPCCCAAPAGPCAPAAEGACAQGGGQEVGVLHTLPRDLPSSPPSASVSDSWDDREFWEAQVWVGVRVRGGGTRPAGTRGHPSRAAHGLLSSSTP